MSETIHQVNNVPEDLNQFQRIDIDKYSNGSEHFYGINAEGKHKHISAESVLNAYGYASGESYEPIDGGSVTTSGPDTEPTVVGDTSVGDTSAEETTPLRTSNLGRSTDNGWKDMEATAKVKLGVDKNGTTRKERFDSVEARRNSPEVSLLNDAAELRIYGSKGREYTNAAGELIANADNIIPSRVERIMNSPTGTNAERTARAEEYTAGVDGLLADGFELTQADFLMDLRLSDIAQSRNMIGKFVADGMDATEAQAKVQDIYAKKEAKRLELVKENGYMTLDEYANRNGESPTSNPPEAPEVRNDEFSDEQKEAIAKAESELTEARQAYIDISSKRRKVAVGVTSTDNDVIEARDAYFKALGQAGELVKGAFDSKEVSQEDILEIAKVGWAKEAESLYKDGLQVKQEEIANGKFMGRFNNWWTRQTAVQEDGTKPRFGRLKKVAAMAAMGVAAGAVAGIGLSTAGIGLAGAGLPALIAFRFAKGQAVGRISKNAEAATQAEVHNNANLAATLEQIERADTLMTAETLTGMSYDKTREYVKQNRRRAATAAAIGATAGLLVNTEAVKGTFEWIGDRLPGGGNGGSTPPESTPEIPPVTPVGTNPELPGDTTVGPMPAPEVEIVPNPNMPNTDILNVPNGEGFENSIQDQFGLSDEDSRRAYEAMRPFLGDQANTYVQNGDIRISSPGPLELNPQASEALRNFLQQLQEESVDSLPETS